jgi:hypothetical protein
VLEHEGKTAYVHDIGEGTALNTFFTNDDDDVIGFVGSVGGGKLVPLGQIAIFDINIKYRLYYHGVERGAFGRRLWTRTILHSTNLIACEPVKPYITDHAQRIWLVPATVLRRARIWEALHRFVRWYDPRNWRSDARAWVDGWRLVASIRSLASEEPHRRRQAPPLIVSAHAHAPLKSVAWIVRASRLVDLAMTAFSAPCQTQGSNDWTVKHVRSEIESLSRLSRCLPPLHRPSKSPAWVRSRDIRSRLSMRARRRRGCGTSRSGLDAQRRRRSWMEPRGHRCAVNSTPVVSRRGTPRSRSIPPNRRRYARWRRVFHSARRAGERGV